MAKISSKSTLSCPASGYSGGHAGFILYLLKLIFYLAQQLQDLQKENEKLKSDLRLREDQLFGSKSEKQDSNKKAANTESNRKSAQDNATASSVNESKNKRKRGAQKGHQGNGRKIPPKLPVVECVHEISEQERHCDICHKPFEEETLKPKVSYEVDVKVEFRVKKHIRKVYKKTCECPKPIITAPKPRKIIPKGKFSINFWCKVLIDKFFMHIPIHRQISLMKLNGLKVSKGTIFNGFKYLSQYLLPLYEQFRQESQKSPHHLADETRWKVFTEVEGKNSFLWWLWAFVSKNVVFYLVDKTRSSKVPKEHLKDKLCRILNVDRYSAYKALGDWIQLAFCWVHVRRDFINILVRYPHKKSLCDWANQWIKWIGQLYALNKLRLAARNDAILFAERQTDLERAVSDMEARSREEYALPEQQKVMKSLQNHWQGLTIFVDNPDIPMDNNEVESMLRNPVVGRKNYYGNHSAFGGQFSAMMFTFCQSCIMNGINPDAYLAYYLNECARIGGVPENLERFLPHRLKKEGPGELMIDKND